MSDPLLCAQLLMLLLAVNGAPIVARKLFQQRLSWPLDGGRCAPDGYRWLGRAKTWRGVVAAIGVAAVVAPLLGYPLRFGVQFGALVMMGDAASSLIKRRLGLPPSARATGLDQLPETALPLLLLRDELGLTWGDLLLVMTLFIVSGLILSRLLYRLRIRRRPY